MAYKVLLVDDEPLVIEGLKRALHRESYEVRGAGSAREALEMLAREPADIVVSDELMPGMPGSEFLGIVCEKYPETIRIILTGHPNLDTALRAINKGHIYRFLIKPCSGKEVGITIRQAVQQRELMRKSLSLLETARRQRGMLNELERLHPGITRVETDGAGAISLGEEECDLDSLIEEINEEVKRSESLFR